MYDSSADELWPSGWKAGQEERIAAIWDFSGKVPMPRRQMTCPLCGFPLVMKDWKFHERPEPSPSPWRCDVRMKCVGCSFVPIFGVAVTRQVYKNAPAHKTWIPWRDGQALLKE